jgi:ketol-acid reductoisomerase
VRFKNPKSCNLGLNSCTKGTIGGAPQRGGTLSDTDKPMQILTGPAVAADALRGKRVVVVGYGNQGRAHALNLRDSGLDVLVAGRPGSAARSRAEAEGFRTADTPAAVAAGDLVIVALPDEHHAEAWRTSIAPALRPGQTVGFIHGFSVHFGLVAPPAGVGCVLVAPKGPGTAVRQRYEQGMGIPSLLAVHQERDRADGGPAARDLALAWAAGIGSAHAGVVEVTFKDEAETDLFGEQSVLCGGMMGLAQAAFEILVEAGYPPLLAYTECVHEIKQIADLLESRGPAGMRHAISNTAEFGAYSAAPRIVDEHVRSAMKAVLADIRSGAFAKAMKADADAGSPWFRAQRAAADAHPIEPASAQVRALMPWLRGAAAPPPAPPTP